jgi:hypothetical protein
MDNTYKGKYLVLFLLAVLVASFFVGCTTTKVEYIPTTSTDSIYITKFQKDTLIARDSIFIEHLGDTIKIEKFRLIYRTKDRVDTVYMQHSDTIRITTEVPATLTKWQKAKQTIGGWAIGAFAILFVGFVIWLIRKFK